MKTKTKLVTSVVTAFAGAGLISVVSTRIVKSAMNKKRERQNEVNKETEEVKEETKKEPVEEVVDEEDIVVIDDEDIEV